jgi:AraC family transcriptional regulator of adaptative response / DNA-3-methyladenine glycosylase II
VSCTVRLTDSRDLMTVVSRVRRLLDLDADPVAVDAVLGADPRLAPLVSKRPGLRSPGSVDGFETAVATVVGQQVSVASARAVLGRIVATHGVVAFDGEPWRLFPSPSFLAEADPATLPLPRLRARTVRSVAAAVAAGELQLDPGADRDDVRAALLAVPGVGPWTADYLRMRAVMHPDILLSTDLIVRRAAADLDIDLTDDRPSWSPWRSYASHHLWAHLYADRWSVKP